MMQIERFVTAIVVAVMMIGFMLDRVAMIVGIVVMVIAAVLDRMIVIVVRVMLIVAELQVVMDLAAVVIVGQRVENEMEDRDDDRAHDERKRRRARSESGSAHGHPVSYDASPLGVVSDARVTPLTTQSEHQKSRRIPK